MKDTEPVELIRAVHVVAGGDALLSPRVTKRLLERVAAGSPRRPTPPVLTLLTDRSARCSAWSARASPTTRSAASSS